MIRGYDAALRLHVLPDLGGMKLSDVRRTDVQAIADRMLADGADASTIRDALLPLRVVFRRADPALRWTGASRQAESRTTTRDSA